MPPPPFAHLLRTWREAKGWTVYRLGKQAGVDASHITRLEAGRQQPSLAIARRLAAALGRSLAELDATTEE